MFGSSGRRVADGHVCARCICWSLPDVAKPAMRCSSGQFQLQAVTCLFCLRAGGMASVAMFALQLVSGARGSTANPVKRRACEEESVKRLQHLYSPQERPEKLSQTLSFATGQVCHWQRCEIGGVSKADGDSEPGVELVRSVPIFSSFQKSSGI